MNRFFRLPFAFSGDKVAVPEPAQVDGTVSYESGYTPDYQLEQGVDPDAKNIERDKMNQLFFDVTTALREYQVFGRPDFITTAQNGGSPYPYDQYAQVKWTDGKVYESLVNANMADPTDPTKWKQVQNFVLADNIATLTQAQNGTDNATVMTPLRVAQAVPAASEATAGRAKVATQVQTNTGTDDGTIVTPLKLRFGFQVWLSSNGGVDFPTWLGGLCFRWGSGDVNGAATLAYVAPYPTQTLQGVAVFQGNAAGGANSYPMLTSFTAANVSLATGQDGRTVAMRYFTVGF